MKLSYQPHEPALVVPLNNLYSVQYQVVRVFRLCNLVCYFYISRDWFEIQGKTVNFAVVV